MKDYSVLSDLPCQWAQLVTAYDKGYEQGYVEGQKHDLEHTENIVRSHEKCKSVLEAEYERGLNDAWMCAKKIISKNGEGYNATDLEVFGVDDGLELSALEAVERLKEYEKKHYDLPESMRGEIKVGDIVETRGFSKPVIVINTPFDFEDSDEIKVMNYLGDTAWVKIENCSMTGRHIDKLAETFEQLKNE